MTDEQNRLGIMWSCWLLAALALLLAACSPSEKRVCKFTKADIVYSVLDERKGQVVDAYPNCIYKVRFAGDQDTQKRSWNVDTLPYATVYMKEFELRR